MAYNPKYPERIETWRARKWGSGLCGNCGKHPLAKHKDGRPMLRCRVCYDKWNKKQNAIYRAKVTGQVA